MIQRKQSIYLFIAALLNSSVFYFDLYKTHSMVNGADVTGQLRVADHFPSLLIALVITLLPFVTIFLFNNRKRQIRMNVISIISIIAFVALLLWRVGNINPPPTSGNYWIGAVLPVVSLVFMVLATIGIRRDEKLVKSVDRLR